MKVYTELEVWKESRILVSEIYAISKSFPQQERYGLTDQIRRCAVSIPSNIAEGCGRRTAADTIQFLYISRGSLYELETQLYIALDLNYISNEDFLTVNSRILSCKKLINGFVKYHKSEGK
jgi:four helix bundle protein